MGGGAGRAFALPTSRTGRYILLLRGEDSLINYYLIYYTLKVLLYTAAHSYIPFQQPKKEVNLKIFSELKCSACSEFFELMYHIGI